MDIRKKNALESFFEKGNPEFFDKDKTDKVETSKDATSSKKGPGKPPYAKDKVKEDMSKEQHMDKKAQSAYKSSPQSEPLVTCSQCGSKVKKGDTHKGVCDACNFKEKSVKRPIRETDAVGDTKEEDGVDWDEYNKENPNDTNKKESRKGNSMKKVKESSYMDDEDFASSREEDDAPPAKDPQKTKVKEDRQTIDVDNNGDQSPFSTDASDGGVSTDNGDRKDIQRGANTVDPRLGATINTGKNVFTTARGGNTQGRFPVAPEGQVGNQKESARIDMGKLVERAIQRGLTGIELEKVLTEMGYIGKRE